MEIYHVVVCARTQKTYIRQIFIDSIACTIVVKNCTDVTQNCTLVKFHSIAYKGSLDLCTCRS
jgi:hypothetical protein